MKLLIETSSDIETLEENTSEGKKWYLEGRYLQGGRRGIKEDTNGNGRIYTEEVLDPAVKKFNENKVMTKTALGELSHPQSPVINPDRVCVVVESLTKDGIHYNGRARIATGTPTGQIVIGILEAGGKLGVSSRALGTLSEYNGIKHVNNDLVITAIDVVTDPSGKGCWMNSIMESVNYEMLDDGTVIQLAVDSVKKKIDEAKLLKELGHLALKFGNR